MTVLESIRGAGAEVIVVDSSESDASERICNGSGVVSKYFRRPDLRQVPATNEGIKQSTGEFVRVFSDDDILVPEGHRKAVKVFQQNPDIDMLVTGGVKFWTNGEKGWPISLPESAGYGRNIDSIFQYGSFGGGQIIRRNVFDKIGYFRPISICDQEYAMRMCAAGLNVRFVRVLSYFHPIYEHSGMRMRKPQVDMEFAQLRTTFNPLDPYMREMLYPPIWDEAVV
jgi:glycosyltransferase involved in cell wall biosynthesis